MVSDESQHLVQRMEDNLRPVMPLNQRLVRTNINFHNNTVSAHARTCSSIMTSQLAVTNTVVTSWG